MSRDWREPFFVVFVVLIVVLGLLTWMRRPSGGFDEPTYATGAGSEVAPTPIILPTPQPTPGPELTPSEARLVYSPDAIALEGEVPSQPQADALVTAAASLVGRSQVVSDLEVVIGADYTGTVLTLLGEVVDDVERARVIAAMSGIGVSIEDQMVLAGADLTVLEVLAQTAGLADMADFLAATGVSAELAGREAPITVFAVVDDAMGDLDTATLTVFKSDFRLLAGVLRYHLVDGLYTTRELSALDSVTTLSGLVVAVGTDDSGSATFGTGRIVTADLEASDGVVHVIDAMQVPPSVATEIALNRIVELDPVQFGPGSSVILDPSREILEQAASILIANPTGRVEIQGHTDTDGDANRNLALSQDRAEAVRDFLVELGVDPARLTAVGYGETALKIDPELTPGDKAINRRIEFRVETG